MNARFSNLLEASPELPAVHAQGRNVTRGELLAASAAASRGLAGLGLRRGDSIAVWLPDGVAWLALLFAAAKLGVLMVPISTRYKETEALHVVSTARARALFVPMRFLDFDYRGAAQRIRDACPYVGYIVEMNAGETFAWPVGAGSAHAVERGELADELCTFTTSGTTGKPKLAVHTQSGIATHARNVASATGMSQGDVVLCALPLYGVLGFVQAIAAFAAHAACVLQPVFKAEEAAAAIERFGVTHFFGSDAMLDRVLAIADRSFATWRCGGFAEFAGLGAQVIARAQDRCNLPLTGIYGMSECFALTAIRGGDGPAVDRALGGGKPVARTIEFRIADPETGTPIRDGEEGELQLRGYNVMARYLNNPAATAEAFTADGWLRTGDLAVRQGEGFCYRARLRDSLRLRGYLVDPAEIEEFLCRHPQLAAAQVVGVHMPGEGDVAAAFVVPKGPTRAGLEASLIAHCKAGIASYKVPRRVFVVDGFPQVEGPNGVKIIKAALREMASKNLIKEIL